MNEDQDQATIGKNHCTQTILSVEKKDDPVSHNGNYSETAIDEQTFT
jgi:hypothetical protein